MAHKFTVGPCHRGMIASNIAQWKREQFKKAHKNDPDCPVDNTHINRARMCSDAVEEWYIDLKTAWAAGKCRDNVLKHRPFVFGDD